MPILYKNKTIHNMKTINELTQDEANEWIFIKNIDPLTGYTQLQANKLTQLVKTYIDPNQRNCAHCGSTGSLKEAKDKFVQFYIDNTETIKAIAIGNNFYNHIEYTEEPLTSLDIAIIASDIQEEEEEEEEEVKIIKNKRKRK